MSSSDPNPTQLAVHSAIIAIAPALSVTPTTFQMASKPAQKRRGPPDSPFAGGEYHGVVLFPSDYPFKPPGIKMYTPSGRFEPEKKICFSMSDFHPGTWNPAWSTATILTGLLSFMLSDEMTTGSVNSSDDDKRAFAAQSHTWNLTQNKFKNAFPEYCTPEPKDVPNMPVIAPKEDSAT